MKRFLASALIVGVASCFGLAGCGEESKDKGAATTPGGTGAPDVKGTTPGATPPGAPVTPAPAK
jgi:hypothetical protein